jgi:membrane protein YdbS with pleckstrin-like domain
MADDPDVKEDQERGLWIVAVLWGTPFAACVLVLLWGFYGQMPEKLIAFAATAAVYAVFYLVGALRRRRRERRQREPGPPNR